MTGGWVLIGDQAYRNSWVPQGQAIRQPLCWICMDTGTVIDTFKIRREPCDCKRGPSGDGES